MDQRCYTLVVRSDGMVSFGGEFLPTEVARTQLNLGTHPEYHDEFFNAVRAEVETALNDMMRRR